MTLEQVKITTKTTSGKEERTEERYVHEVELVRKRGGVYRVKSKHSFGVTGMAVNGRETHHYLTDGNQRREVTVSRGNGNDEYLLTVC